MIYFLILNTIRKALTAFVVDDTLLRLLGLELAERAVLRILFDVALSRPHPHPTGHAAGRPADPFRHHTRRWLCPPESSKRKHPHIRAISL